MQDQIFKVVPIEGKGFGVVATKFIKKGDFVLKENPQMPSTNKETWKNYVKEIVSNFNLMNQCDQNEYLELDNKYETENSQKEPKYLEIQTEINEIEKDSKKAEELLKIVCIYRTNAFNNGLSIKTSRFNHSCQPNAARTDEIRAISDIEEGQEITISYIRSKYLFL